MLQLVFMDKGPKAWKHKGWVESSRSFALNDRRKKIAIKRFALLRSLKLRLSLTIVSITIQNFTISNFDPKKRKCFAVFWVQLLFLFLVLWLDIIHEMDFKLSIETSDSAREYKIKILSSRKIEAAERFKRTRDSKKRIVETTSTGC